MAVDAAEARAALRRQSVDCVLLDLRLPDADGIDLLDEIREGPAPPAVVVMTSNLGSQMIQSMSGDDPALIKLAVMAEVKTQFRPEFVNRIDEIVVFHALDEKHIEGIAAIQLQRLVTRLAKMDITLEVSPAALAELARAGFDPVYGARPLKRAIQQQLENPLSREILEGHFAAKDRVLVDVQSGRMKFSKPH